MNTRIESVGIYSGVVIGVLLLLPNILSACPTCFAASGPTSLRAYYISTILLSAMPFVLIGLIAAIAYVEKRVRDREIVEPSSDGH